MHYRSHSVERLPMMLFFISFSEMKKTHYVYPECMKAVSKWPQSEVKWPLLALSSLSFTRFRFE